MEEPNGRAVRFFRFVIPGGLLGLFEVAVSTHQVRRPIWQGAPARCSQSDDLVPIVMLYRDGLGFEVLVRVHGPRRFEGVFIGRAEAAYHLAFVPKVGNGVGQAPTEDSLILLVVLRAGRRQCDEERVG